MAKGKFENELLSLLRRYIDDPSDFGHNGANGSNGEPLKTRNPKTIEKFYQWLKNQ